MQDTGSLETDKAAADHLIRQYLKERGHQTVVLERGLEHKDVAVVDMEVKLKGGRTPLPGLSKTKFIFDTDDDPLGAPIQLLLLLLPLAPILM